MNKTQAKSKIYQKIIPFPTPHKNAPPSCPNHPKDHDIETVRAFCNHTICSNCRNLAACINKAIIDEPVI